MSPSEWDELPGTPQWIDPETGGRSKSHIVILFRMSNLIPSAAQDAQAREMERKAKQKGRRF